MDIARGLLINSNVRPLASRTVVPTCTDSTNHTLAISCCNRRYARRIIINTPELLVRRKSCWLILTCRSWPHGQMSLRVQHRKMILIYFSNLMLQRMVDKTYYHRWYSWRVSMPHGLLINPNVLLLASLTDAPTCTAREDDTNHTLTISCCNGR